LHGKRSYFVPLTRLILPLSAHKGPNVTEANMAQHATPVTPPSKTLPVDGMSRWNQIAQFSPFSREKFRQLVNAGKAPPAVRLSQRCTAYSNRELHKFFADPLNYSAGEK